MTDEVSLDRLSTAAVPAAERYAFWEQSVSALWQQMTLQGGRDTPADFRAEFTNVGAGCASIATGFLDPVCAAVTAVEARERDPDSLILALQGAGRLAVDARGERHEYPNRTLLLRSVDEPTVHTYSARTPMVLLAVSTAQLSIPLARLRPLMFRPLSLDPGLSAMFVGAARAARRSAPQRDATGMQGYLHGLAELLLRTVSGSEPEHAGTAVVRRQQARDIIRARLGDPALSTATVASELGISVRRLQQVFAGQTSVAQEIRQLRLTRAQRLLRDPLARHQSIAAVARRCGYADHTNFSRAFRQATGMTPRDFRA